MSDFAKLYRADDIGQVLVMLDAGEDGPEIIISFKPKGLGVCAVRLGFKGTDAVWDLAEGAFEKIDEEFAMKIVRNTMAGSQIGALSASLGGEE